MDSSACEKSAENILWEDEPRYVVAESACFGCSTADEWVAYFTAIFSNSSNPYGRVDHMRYYNIAPFVQARRAPSRGSAASLKHTGMTSVHLSSARGSRREREGAHPAPGSGVGGDMYVKYNVYEFLYKN